MSNMYYTTLFNKICNRENISGYNKKQLAPQSKAYYNRLTRHCVYGTTQRTIGSNKTILQIFCAATYDGDRQLAFFFFWFLVLLLPQPAFQKNVGNLFCDAFDSLLKPFLLDFLWFLLHYSIMTRQNVNIRRENLPIGVNNSSGVWCWKLSILICAGTLSPNQFHQSPDYLTFRQENVTIFLERIKDNWLKNTNDICRFDPFHLYI